MYEFIFASQNMPFTVAITIMLGITILEGMDLFLGVGISDLIESMMPDFDFDIDVDMDVEGNAPSVDSPSGFVKALGWLRFGELPVLVILIIFLTSFGLIGFGVQSVSKSMTGSLLSGGLASIPAFFLSLPVLRVFGGLLARILPKDETDAVSEKSFIGKTATIILGTASHGKSAQAKLQDKHGTTHYVMVEPDNEGDFFETGTCVLLVRQAGPVFKVVFFE